MPKDQKKSSGRSRLGRRAFVRSLTAGSLGLAEADQAVAQKTAPAAPASGAGSPATVNQNTGNIDRNLRNGGV
jgi:hypothetical protein